MKEIGDSVNDTWIYLLLGLSLIIVGAGLITLVVILNIRAKNHAKADQTISAHTAPPPLKKKHSPSRSAQLPKNLDDTLDEPLDLKDIRK